MGSPREPERTCVGCREQASKGTLLRVVRRPDGVVQVDPGGKATGRGAYLHRDAGCVDLALHWGSLGRALRAGLSAGEAARLKAEIEREVGQ